LYPNSCLTCDVTCNQSPKVDVDCVIIDSIQVEVELENNNKWEKMYEMNYCFQDAWVAKLPWEKLMVVVDGRVHKVTCKVYNKIEKCDKLLLSKLKYLWEHVDQRNATTAFPSSTVVWEHYFFKTKKHVFNE
jgi:hypothetical protein